MTPSGSIRFGITLSNTGNLLLTYSGVVAIVDGNGHHVALLLQPDNAYVVPSGQVQLAAVSHQLPPGATTFRAQATITLLANGVPVGTLTSQSVALQLPTGTPIAIVAGVALLLAALLLLVVLSIRRRACRRSRLTAGNILDRRLTSLR
jgi:hypothetical protein